MEFTYLELEYLERSTIEIKSTVFVGNVVWYILCDIQRTTNIYYYSRRRELKYHILSSINSFINVIYISMKCTSI